MHGVVVLAAETTERQGQQDSLAVTGDEPLTIESQVTSLRRLRRRKHGVSLADELVQPERECGKLGNRVAQLVAPHELRPDEIGASILISLTRQLGELARGAAVT